MRGMAPFNPPVPMPDAIGASASTRVGGVRRLLPPPAPTAPTAPTPTAAVAEAERERAAPKVAAGVMAGTRAISSSTLGAEGETWTRGVTFELE